MAKGSILTTTVKSARPGLKILSWNIILLSGCDTGLAVEGRG